MAFPADAGDISQITELGRFNIPGTGHNNIGQAKNNKVMVWGQIKGLYDSTGLDALQYGTSESLFGLTVLDNLSLSVRTTGTAGTPVNVTSLKHPLAQLTQPLGKIFVADDVGQADPAVPSGSDTIVINYVAFGEELGVDLV